MSSFRAAKFRGKALARQLAGITLPLPGGGSVTIPDVAAAAPSAVVTATTLPTFLAGSTVQTVRFKWPGANSGSQETIYFNRKVAGEAANANTDCIKVELRNTGKAVVNFYIGGAAQFSNITFESLSSTPPAGTSMECTRGADGSIKTLRLDTGDNITPTLTTARVLGNVGNQTLLNSNYGGTYVSATATEATQMQALGDAIPLSISGGALGTGYRPSVEIIYTGSGHTGWNIQLQTVGGQAIGAKVPATVTVIEPGRVSLSAGTTFGPDQFSTDVVARVFEVVNGAETGVYRDLQLSMPGRPATFGANLTTGGPYGPLRAKADAFRDGYYQDTSNGFANIGANVAGKTDANGWPLSVAARRQIAKADVSGQKMIITWDGDGSVNPGLFTTTEGDSVISQKTAVDSNTYSYVQTFTRTGIGGNSFVGIQFNPGTTGPKNIKIYPEGEDRSAYWASSYLTFVNKANIFSGSMRIMDGRNINGNGTIDMTWAMRTLPDPLYSGTGKDGESIERCIELANSAQRDLYLPIPAYATDDYVTQLAIAIDTGANLSQGKPWSNGLWAGGKWFAERGNEVWNTAFANYQYDRDRYVARTLETRLSDGGGGTEQSAKEHAFQYNRMMNLIKAAIPSYATRVVRTFATQRNLLMYNIALQSGYGGNIDALAMAPYFTVADFATQINASGKTPAEIEPYMLSNIDSVMSSMLPFARAARTNGHRFICYEAGMDWADQNDSTVNGANDPTGTSYNGKPWYMTPYQIFQFRTSPSFYRCTYRYFNSWKSQFGDEMNQYYDIGGTAGPSTTNPNARFQWGLKPYQGSPDPDYGVLALQDVVAGLPPRY